MARMFQNLGKVLTGPTDTLKLKCGACKHEAEWTRTRALNTFGERAVPFDVTRRLRCSRCQERSNIRAWV